MDPLTQTIAESQRSFEKKHWVKGVFVEAQVGAGVGDSDDLRARIARPWVRDSFGDL